MSWQARSFRYRDQQREVVRRLTLQGLAPGPRPLGRGATEDWSGRLRQVLGGLGPLAASFGRYLASRPDHLPVSECLALDQIVVQHPPTGRVVARLGEALGRPVADLYSTFDEDPFQVSELDQSHRARLTDGRPVIVRLAHPEIGDEDVETLRALAPAFRDGICPASGVPFDQVVEDFLRHRARRLDYAAQAAAFEALGRDPVDGDLLWVPDVLVALTAEKAMTSSVLEGTRPVALEPPPGREAEFQELGRRFSLMWLQQALIGGLFPVEAELGMAPDGRLVLGTGAWHRLPTASQPGVWNYLTHSAAHRPTEALAALRRELRKQSSTASEAELSLRLRQVVPFRDGAWTDRGDTVAEYLVLHWQLLRPCGFEPTPAMRAVYEGLFWGARRCRRWAPDCDPLREAQDDLRWLASWQQVRQLVDPRRLGPSLEQGVGNLMDMPRKLDQLLDLATDDNAQLSLRLTEPPTVRRRRSSIVTVISLALLMGSLVVVAQRFAGTEGVAELVAGDRLDQLSAVVFLILGLWLLKTITQGDSHA